MPFSERLFSPIEAPASEVEKPPAPDFSRMSASELAAYKSWKANVPSPIRALVEGQMIGKHARVDKDGLPFVVEFLRATRQALQNPQMSAEELSAPKVIQRQIAALQNVSIGETSVNVFSALADPKVGFDVKENYVKTKLLPRLEFLRARDERESKRVRDAEQETNVSGSEEDDEYTVHRKAYRQVFL